MQSSCAVFNFSNRADREKNKSNYRFPSIKKKWQRKLETFESEKGKVVSSNFQERFNREKARKTRMKIILSASR